MIKVVDGNPLKLANPLSDTIYATINFCYGSANEPEGKHGLNHLLEHILVGMLEGRLSGIGHRVVCDGITDTELLRVDAATVKTNLNALLDAVSWLMETDELDRSIFNAEFPAILGAADLPMDPYELVLETSRKSVFEGSRFEHPPDGYKREIESITIDDCNKAWQTVRKGCKSVLGLYGDVENADFDFKHGERVTPNPGTPIKSDSIETIVGISGAECCYGAFVAGYDPDLIDFLGYIIGGPRYGLLYTVLREEYGLAYDTRAIVKHYSTGTLVRLYFGIDDKSKLQKSCDTLWDAIIKFKLDENSLKFQKEAYKCKLLFEMDNPERFLAKTTYRKLIGIEPDPVKIFAGIDAFDTDIINEKLCKVFVETNFSLSKVI